MSPEEQQPPSHPDPYIEYRLRLAAGVTRWCRLAPGHAETYLECRKRAMDLLGLSLAFQQKERTWGPAMRTVVDDATDEQVRKHLEWPDLEAFLEKTGSQPRDRNATIQGVARVQR